MQPFFRRSEGSRRSCALGAVAKVAVASQTVSNLSDCNAAQIVKLRRFELTLNTTEVKVDEYTPSIAGKSVARLLPDQMC